MRAFRGIYKTFIFEQFICHLLQTEMSMYTKKSITVRNTKCTKNKSLFLFSLIQIFELSSKRKVIAPFFKNHFYKKIKKQFVGSEKS